jgi:hypothetical protein
VSEKLAECAGEAPLAVMVFVAFCAFPAAEIVNRIVQVGFGVHVPVAGDAVT